MIFFYHDCLFSFFFNYIHHVGLRNIDCWIPIIDHLCLLETLKTHFLIDGKVLEWIASYLSDRKRTIELEDTVSDVFNVPFGVPEGSRLGPLLFTMYTSRLLTNIQKEFPVITCHCYADDTQIYLSFCPNTSNEDYCITLLEYMH